MLDLILPFLVNGCSIALVALAFHLVIRATGGIADFAIGQYMIVGGLAAALASSGLQLSTLLVLFVGCLSAAAVAGLNEAAVIRPTITLNRNPLAMAPVLVTVSLLIVWEQIARLVFGDVPVRGPSFFSGVKFTLGEVIIPAHSAVIVLVTVLVFVLVQLWLKRTVAGRMLRAIGDNRAAADLLGFPVNRSRAIAFILAGGCVGAAGALVSPLAGFRAIGGGYFTLNGIVALFLGGAASPAGAFLGGLLLEAVKIAIGRYLGNGYQDYLVLVVALVVFAFRPQGILGAKKTRSS
jgi:branched-chain amino acid transport system permease protein